jgi:hypothetical protein
MPLGFAIVALLLIGFNNTGFSGMRSFGFYNVNAGSAVAFLGASCFLFKDGKMKWMEMVALAFCLICIFIGHSRNTLAMLIILVLFRYKLSPKLLVAGLAMVSLLMIVQSFGYEVSAVDRLLGTIEGTVDMDRENQREATWWMIAQHPYDGNGFVSKNYGEASLLTELGAHNGYLTTIKQMGYIMGGGWFAVLFFAIWKIKDLILSSSLLVRRQVGIVIAILFAAMNEDFFIGVNQITTNMFFVSLCLLLIYKNQYYGKKKIRVS